MPFRIAFLGTGEFALPSFRAIANSAHTLVGLVTQPDRTDARGRVHPNVMKEFALERGLPVLQPTNINSEESLAQLRALDAELFMVAAYGQILSADVINLPPRGSYNLHGSLLPKYRGAAPIQYAVWKGERETGVTIFKIEPKLDAGLMLATMKTPIGPKETAGELEIRMAELVVPTTLQFLDDLERGQLSGTLQDKSLVTKAPKLKKEFGAIDWSQTAAQIDCQVRAMQPWPQPYGFLKVEGKPPLRVLILAVGEEGPRVKGLGPRARVDGEQPDTASTLTPSPSPGRGEPEDLSGQPPVTNDQGPGTTDSLGTVVRSDGKSLAIRCGDGLCRIEAIQPVGKRPMAIADFLRGNPVPVGSRIDMTEQ